MVNIRGCEFQTLKGLIGIGGKAYTGKSTLGGMLADLLIDKGYFVYHGAYGDALKLECSEATGIPLDLFYSPDPTVKENLRILMQWWGTEYRRNTMFGGYYDYWLDQFVRNCAQVDDLLHAKDTRTLDFIIASDIRFENEAELIRSQDVPSYMIHVEAAKPKTTTRNSKHVSEKKLEVQYNDWLVMNNQDRGLDELRHTAEELIIRMGL